MWLSRVIALHKACASRNADSHVETISHVPQTSRRRRKPRSTRKRSTYSSTMRTMTLRLGTQKLLRPRKTLSAMSNTTISPPRPPLIPRSTVPPAIRLHMHISRSRQRMLLQLKTPRPSHRSGNAARMLTTSRRVTAMPRPSAHRGRRREHLFVLTVLVRIALSSFHIQFASIAPTHI